MDFVYKRVEDVQISPTRFAFMLFAPALPATPDEQ